MRRLCHSLLVLALGAAWSASAQQATPLPKSLSGRWVAVVPGRTTFTDTMSLTLDDATPSGPVSGRVTIRGLSCGAKDEPFTGTWNGTQLRIEFKSYPNVNVQRLNGDCGSGQAAFVFTRRPGEAGFDGEGTRDGSPVPIRATLSP